MKCKKYGKIYNGFEGLYQVSNLGQIKSFRRKKETILKPRKDKDGYLLINLYKNTTQYTLKVHRIVAQAYINNPNNFLEVNHKDENKSNNCIDNLEWCTHTYNNNYGNKNKTRSKKVNQYDLSGKYIRTFNSINRAAKELNISNNISLCCKNKINSCGGYYWKYAS